MNAATAQLAPTSSMSPVASGRVPHGVVRSAARGLLVLLATVVVIVAVWSAFLRLADVSPLVAQSPADVWAYLVTAPEAAANRASLWPLLGRTLTDAALGYGSGLALAAAVALLCHFFDAVKEMLTPSLTAMHAIPMVTVAPVLVLVFGRANVGTAVIGAAIVFVPALLTMQQGLRSAPRTRLDLCAAYGAGRWVTFTKVALPYALPAWFTAARITVTTSVVGGLLAEWLASGAGLGGQMLRDANEFQFARLWSSVVLLTVVCVAIYQLLAVVEAAVRNRTGP
jgi:ABC-type nitrate/sulfonate/bicarbonate transport system permease component